MAGYDPIDVTQFHGKALVRVGSKLGTDGCTQQLIAKAGSGGLPGIGPSDVDRAYQEFDLPCGAHDYACDLIRYGRKGMVVNYPYDADDAVVDRKVADDIAEKLAASVCNDAPWYAPFEGWDKRRCKIMQEVMYPALMSWTKIEGAPK